MSALGNIWLAKSMGARARRRPRAIGPALSPATIVVVAGTAILRVHRPLRSPNRSLWAHWRVKHRERNAWEATIRQALIVWVDDQARTRAARGELAKLCTGPLPAAPAGNYSVAITRFVPRVSDLITDEDNLTFSAKPAFDALVSCGLIYSDQSEFLDRPKLVQSVRPGEGDVTEFRIAPWWRTG
jgi:hypothetical protein